HLKFLCGSLSNFATYFVRIFCNENIEIPILIRPFKLILVLKVYFVSFFYETASYGISETPSTNTHWAIQITLSRPTFLSQLRRAPSVIYNFDAGVTFLIRSVTRFKMVYI
ncbi:hypothetical protein L9F63_015972, partial [Diploptera punctata]